MITKKLTGQSNMINKKLSGDTAANAKTERTLEQKSLLAENKGKVHAPKDNAQEHEEQDVDEEAMWKESDFKQEEEAEKEKEEKEEEKEQEAKKEEDEGQ